MEIIKLYEDDNITDKNKIETLSKLFNDLNIKTITEKNIAEPGSKHNYYVPDIKTNNDKEFKPANDMFNVSP